MRIAILGWGSLIWNPDTLRMAGEWERNGPALPIEFSRISRDGRLTLVIDERHGVPVLTRSVRSGCENLTEAIGNLRTREGPGAAISFIDLVSGVRDDNALKRHPKTFRTIESWCQEHPFDAVIWAALKPKFEEIRGAAFSVEAAIRYLDELEEPKRSAAFEYIRNAPVEVRTPVRHAFAHKFVAGIERKIKAAQYS